MDDNINLDLSLTIGPPPRPSPPPRLAEYRSATSPISIFRPLMDDDINLDLSLTIGPPPRPSPPEYRSATSPTSIFRPIIPPICSPQWLSKTHDLSRRLAYPKWPPPPSESSSPSNFFAASTSALMEFDAEYSASSHRCQQWRDGSSSDFSSTDMRQQLQLSPPTPQRPSTPLPPPSSTVDPSPSQVSASASTSSPPSPQHHYPRPLLPGRCSLVLKIGSKSSSSAPFPKQGRSDLTAIPLPISRVADRAPDAAAENRDEERILEPIPFAWASDRPAGVRSLAELRRLKITKVKGRLRCNSCNQRVEKEYEIEAEFNKLAAFVVAKEGRLNDRAPEEWMRPAAAECPDPRCGKPALKAEMPAAEKVEELNWLFMLLGRTLAQCNLKQLKYFCRNNGNLHRSGAKDRLLYKTYMCLCSQLDPDFRSRLRKEVAGKMAFDFSNYESS